MSMKYLYVRVSSSARCLIKAFWSDADRLFAHDVMFSVAMSQTADEGQEVVCACNTQGSSVTQMKKITSSQTADGLCCSSPISLCLCSQHFVKEQMVFIIFILSLAGVCTSVTEQQYV